ncbi:Ni/Fe-hydrogenase, b-type cytochrome subunit [Pectinatus cerevisiiphilus]|uniref:Ni/Fe-hydrogenase 1 B-type cytochrome subunit n=1 Tax=Pectinatus cerevisiiphilus TaxID=86956 RepID=A0A4R3K853_9FIRM|nr:Ni/Fe-hydrogenase, b-type cytochrome subunit [Pectinatus cerevisiiphilus]TCS78963.1 Ni/Fe-hydrogenase 1 B-type cytochrome subunit [Pectinatus cerevisiiphilus]
MTVKESQFIEISMDSGKEMHLTRYYIFSPFLRIFHWLMVVSIIVLFASGIVIMTPMSMGEGQYVVLNNWHLSVDWIRNLHFVAGFVLTASFLFRIYGYIINKGDRLLPNIFRMKFWDDLVEVMMHYCLLKYSHKQFLRNPMARMSYVAIYGLIVVEMLTGFAMYFQVNPNGVGSFLFGWLVIPYGEMFLHVVHHIVAWCIFLFAAIHVYMVVRADFMEREGEISSMISGTKVLAHLPDDINDIRDKRGRIIKG